MVVKGRSLVVRPFFLVVSFQRSGWVMLCELFVRWLWFSLRFGVFPVALRLDSGSEGLRARVNQVRHLGMWFSALVVRVIWRPGW